MVNKITLEQHIDLEKYLDKLEVVRNSKNIAADYGNKSHWSKRIGRHLYNIVIQNNKKESVGFYFDEEFVHPIGLFINLKKPSVKKVIKQEEIEKKDMKVCKKLKRRLWKRYLVQERERGTKKHWVVIEEECFVDDAERYVCASITTQFRVVDKKTKKVILRSQ